MRRVVLLLFCFKIVFANAQFARFKALPGFTICTAGNQKVELVFDTTLQKKCDVYRWDFGDNTTDTGFTVSHVFKKTGTFNIKLWVKTNQTNFEDSVVKSLVLNFAPQPVIAPRTVCTPNPLTDTMGQYTKMKGTWNWKQDGELVGKSTFPFGVLHPPYGKHKVDLIVIYDNFCIVSTSDSITLLPGVRANFSVMDACFGDTFKFINSTSFPGVKDSLSTYRWDFGNGLKDTSKNPFVNSHFVDTTRTYFAKLVHIFPWGCMDSVRKSYTVHELPRLDYIQRNAALGHYIFGASDAKGNIFPSNFNIYWSYFSLKKNKWLVQNFQQNTLKIADSLVTNGDSIFVVCEAPGTLCRKSYGNRIIYDSRNTTGISKTRFIIFPNPATANSISVFNRGRNLRAVIMDVIGKEYSNIELNSGVTQINIANFAPGLYFIKSEDGAVMRFEIAQP